MSNLSVAPTTPSRTVRKPLTVSLLALALASGAVVVAPSMALAQAGPLQQASAAPSQKILDVTVSLAGVRYSHITSATPYVDVFVWVKNTSGRAVMLTPKTFDVSVMQDGTTFTKHPDSSSFTYSFAPSLGVIGGRDQRTLAAGDQVLIVSRVQISPRGVKAPLYVSVLERPLIALPNKKEGRANLSGPGYFEAAPAPPARTDDAPASAGFGAVTVPGSGPYRTMAYWQVTLSNVTYYFKDNSGDRYGFMWVRARVKNVNNVPRPATGLLKAALHRSNGEVIQPVGIDGGSTNVAPGAEEEVLLRFRVGDESHQRDVTTLVLTELDGRGRDAGSTAFTLTQPPQTATPTPPKGSEPQSSVPKAPAPPPPPPTPPVPPLPTEGVQSLPATSSAFSPLSPWRARVNSVTYDMTQQTLPGVATVRVTLQNVQRETVHLKGSLILGQIGPEKMQMQMHQEVLIAGNGAAESKNIDVAIAPNEAVEVAFVFRNIPEDRMKALGHFNIGYANSTDNPVLVQTTIPRFTRVSAPALPTKPAAGSGMEGAPKSPFIAPPAPRPVPAGGLPAPSSTATPLGPWRVRLESVVYDLRPSDKPGRAVVRVTLQNINFEPARLAPDWVQGAVGAGDNAFKPVTKTELQFGGLTYLGATEVVVPHTEAADLTFIFDLSSEAELRGLRYFRARLGGSVGATAMLDLPPMPGAPRGEGPNPAPAPTPGPAPTLPPLTQAELEALRVHAGLYHLGQGAQITFAVENQGLVGRARGADGQARETVVLTPFGNGLFRGTWRELSASGVKQGNVTVNFDTTGFRGRVEFGAGAPAVPYEGQRNAPEAPAPDPTPTPAPASQGDNSGGGFRATAYLELQIEKVGRSSLGGVEVLMTAHNTEEVRKGLQYDPQKYFVMGSDGMEYSWDGNYYGRSSEDKLNETTWLFQNSRAPVTYVFPRVPTGVKAVRLILRDNGRQTATFDLN